MRDLDYTEVYLTTITEMLRKIREQEKDNIIEAATLMAKQIALDKLVHVYGTGGHSIMAVHEMFMRSGGLVPINPLLDQGLDLIFGVKKIERVPGYAERILHYFEVEEDDLLIISSIPGINAVTIDAALGAKERGATVVGISTREFCKNVPPGHPARHPSNKNLPDVVDVFIDTYVPYGDVCVEIPGCSARLAPLSTIAHAFIVNALAIETARLLVEQGVEPPVWISSNIPGGDEANLAYYEAYKHRVKCL